MNGVLLLRSCRGVEGIALGAGLGGSAACGITLGVRDSSIAPLSSLCPFFTEQRASGNFPMNATINVHLSKIMI